MVISWRFPAQDRPRENRLKMRILNSMSLKLFKHVCEMATQNIQQHHILQPWQGGGRCGKNWATKIVEIATLNDFEEND
jgi:hypothetical protein